jgi:hypothetical protein
MFVLPNFCETDNTQVEKENILSLVNYQLRIAIQVETWWFLTRMRCDTHCDKVIIETPKDQSREH